MLLVLQLQDQADSEGPAWLGGQVMATFVNGWVTLEMRINLGYVSLIGYIYIYVYIYIYADSWGPDRILGFGG